MMLYSRLRCVYRFSVFLKNINYQLWQSRNLKDTIPLFSFIIIIDEFLWTPEADLKIFNVASILGGLFRAFCWTLIERFNDQPKKQIIPSNIYNNRMKNIHLIICIIKIKINQASYK